MVKWMLWVIVISLLPLVCLCRCAGDWVTKVQTNDVLYCDDQLGMYCPGSFTCEELWLGLKACCQNIVFRDIAGDVPNEDRPPALGDVGTTTTTMDPFLLKLYQQKHVELKTTQQHKDSTQTPSLYHRLKMMGHTTKSGPINPTPTTASKSVDPVSAASNSKSTSKEKAKKVPDAKQPQTYFPYKKHSRFFVTLESKEFPEEQFNMLSLPVYLMGQKMAAAEKSTTPPAAGENTTTATASATAATSTINSTNSKIFDHMYKTTSTIDSTNSKIIDHIYKTTGIIDSTNGRTIDHIYKLHATTSEASVLVSNATEESIRLSSLRTSAETEDPDSSHLYNVTMNEDSTDSTGTTEVHLYKSQITSTDVPEIHLYNTTEGTLQSTVQSVNETKMDLELKHVTGSTQENSEYMVSRSSSKTTTEDYASSTSTDTTPTTAFEHALIVYRNESINTTLTTSVGANEPASKNVTVNIEYGKEMSSTNKLKTYMETTVEPTSRSSTKPPTIKFTPTVKKTTKADVGLKEHGIEIIQEDSTAPSLESIPISPPKVVILQEGRAEQIARSQFRLTATITLVQDNDRNILVDTGVPTDSGLRNRLLMELDKYGLTPNSIHYVVSTHGHPDHFGNLNMFPDAIQYFGSWMYFGTTFTFTDLFSTPSLPLTRHVKLYRTPGHTPEDLSVIVRNVPLQGTVAIVGDLFMGQDDIDFPDMWEPLSWNVDIQKSNRRTVMCGADVIVPGHGLMFRASDTLRQRFNCSN